VGCGNKIAEPDQHLAAAVNWYIDASAQLDQVAAGSGSVLNRSSIDQLVNAMARFTTAAGIANNTVTLLLFQQRFKPQ
jgi:2-keto-3-deoxy-6-phosphogluconate aldolase